MGPDQRHERGSGGRLSNRPPQRGRAAQVPRRWPEVVRGHDLVSRTARRRSAAAIPLRETARDVDRYMRASRGDGDARSPGRRRRRHAMRAALVDQRGTVLLRRSAATPGHADVPEALIDLVCTVGAEHHLDAVSSRGRGLTGRRGLRGRPAAVGTAPPGALARSAVA